MRGQAVVLTNKDTESLEVRNKFEAALEVSRMLEDRKHTSRSR